MTIEKKKEIKKELTQARLALRHYQKRVQQFESRLEQLKSSPNGRGVADPNLPRTSSKFWLSLVGKRPKTSQQVIESAIKKLRLDDLPEELVAKLRLRWNVMAIALVKQGQIRDEGARRTRTFQLPAGKQPPDRQ